MTDVRQRRVAYIAWAAVCLIWGTTYLGISITLETLPPALMGGLRWTIAGALLAIFVVARGEKLPPRSRWGGIALLGFLLLGLGNGGVVVAELWVSSGLTAVLVASSPFWMSAVEACLRDGERLRPTTVAGLVVGFSGIVVLVWPELSMTSGGSRGFLAGVLALQIASFGWALGSSYSRRHARQDGILATTAYQMLAGGLMMMAAGTVRGEWSDLFFTTRTALALAYLSTIGAIGGFVAYTYALRHLPVSFVSLYAYINPVIAVALGVVVLNEAFTLRMAVAAALVFAGVGVVSSHRRSGDRKESHRRSGDQEDSDRRSGDQEGFSVDVPAAHVRAAPPGCAIVTLRPETSVRNRREGTPVPSLLSIPPIAPNLPLFAPASDGPPADQAHQEEHEGDDQQHIDEVAERVAADHPEQPHDDQDDRNRFEHLISPSRPRRRRIVVPR